MLLCPDSGMKNSDFPSVAATMSIITPDLSPFIVALPDAYTLP